VLGVLIILVGVGFGVLYDIAGVFADFVRRVVRRLRYPSEVFEPRMRRRVSLQTKLVLVTSLILIVAGMSLILLLENNGNSQNEYRGGGDRVLGALFQSVTSRTAGFNTVDISSMSSASRMVLMVLMFIGGSPGSTAGGIKTVTLSVLVMVVYATLRKRDEVEVFGRSVRASVVGKAITVTVLFAVVFFAVSFALSITERSSGFSMDDIMFETMSALGTVGLSCGVTGELTTAGQLIIIVTMLVGRLGPLTLLASMTFNLKPATYSYPDEPIIVG
jgi:trk system potassium uptake protein TrkH